MLSKAKHLTDWTLNSEEMLCSQGKSGAYGYGIGAISKDASALIILSEVAILTETGYQNKSIGRRFRHIDEAIRYELARQPRIDAPMRKLVIDLQNSEQPRRISSFTQLESVLSVRAEAAESILLGEYAGFRAHLLDAVRDGVAKVEAAFAWSAQPLYEFSTTSASVSASTYFTTISVA